MKGNLSKATLASLEARREFLVSHPPARPAAAGCPRQIWQAWDKEQRAFLNERETLELWITIRRYDATHPAASTVGHKRGRRRRANQQPLVELALLDDSSLDLPEGGDSEPLFDLDQAG